METIVLKPEKLNIDYEEKDGVLYISLQENLEKPTTPSSLRKEL